MQFEKDEVGDDSAGASASRLKFYFPVPICSHPECPQYRDESFKTLPRSAQEKDKPFLTQGAYTKHMREEHNECAFPCDVQGCDRVGRRGYFREKDMIKHRRESHPNASPYQPSERDTGDVFNVDDFLSKVGESSNKREYGLQEYEERSSKRARVDGDED